MSALLGIAVVLVLAQVLYMAVHGQWGAIGTLAVLLLFAFAVWHFLIGLCRGVRRGARQ